MMRYSNKRFLFIPLIIFFLSCTKLFAQNTDRLIGKWELLSIETDTAKIEFPKSGKFLLKISKDSLKYNLSVNSCWTEYQIEDSKIIYHSIACTEICCDDDNSSLINYSGAYSIEGNKLSIKNKVGVYQLNRIKED